MSEEVPVTPSPGTIRVISRGLRFTIGALRVIGLVVLVVIALAATNLGVSWLTAESVIPASCREPTSMDYSDVGPTDWGNYAVEITSRSSITSSTSARALVGVAAPHGGVGYGVGVTLDTTDIERVRCRWSHEGVTIVEPGHGSRPGPEVFVPAGLFLGGR